MERIKTAVKDFPRLLAGGRPGLIVGPGFSLYPGALADVAEEVCRILQVPPRSFWELGSAKETIAVERVRDYVSNSTAFAANPPNYLEALARVKWGAVLSLSPDSRVEDALRKDAAKHMVRREVTVLAEDVGLPVPPGSLPVFKLLGDVSRRNFPMTTSQMRLRRVRYKTILRSCSDAVRSNVYVCVGVTDVESQFLELVAELASLPISSPQLLVFLQDEPVRTTPELMEILAPSARVVELAGTLGELARTLTIPPKPVLKTSTTASEMQELQAKYGHCIAQVVQPADEVLPRNRLLEILFSPNQVIFSPYKAALDLPRSLTTAIEAQLSSLAADPKSSALVVHGASACGKSVLLRRLALNCSNKGLPVFWIRNSSQALYGEAIRAMLRGARNAGASTAYVVIDDAIGCPITPDEVLRAAEDEGMPVCLLVSLRSADWTTRDHTAIIGRAGKSAVFELPDRFDAQEREALPAYLCRLGIYSSTDEAKTEISNKPGALIGDILSLLYFLLPDTRASIVQSVQEEYFRLGDLTGFSRVVIGQMHAGSDLIRKAYELVAVATKYVGGLPIEILVQALGVSYHDWFDATTGKKLGWGLLSPSSPDDSSSDGLEYSTRNSVVNATIVRAINGGVLRSGEVAILHQLIESCQGTSPVYLQFCRKLLVRNDQFKSLDPDPGLLLYHKAVAVLPFKDRVILHHKSLWERDKCSQPLMALRTLADALSSPRYPYAERDEVDEHLHTSFAAAIIIAVDKGELDPHDGRTQALDHLQKARSEQFLNTNAVHVQARLFLKLANQTKGRDLPDNILLRTRALSDLDRTLLIVGQLGGTSDKRKKDVELLSQAKTDMLTIGETIDVSRQVAEDVWERHKSQAGFALVTRRLFNAARTRDKSVSYQSAFDYFQASVKRVGDAGVGVDSSLLEAGLQLYYVWRVQRAVKTTGQEVAVQWDLLLDMTRSILRSDFSRDDPFYSYVEAISLAHLSRWPDAIGRFTRIRQSKMPRDLLYAARDYLIDDQGQIRHVQGRVSRGADRMYLSDSGVGVDIAIDRKSAGLMGVGDIVHMSVQFSFAGPLAVRDE